MATQIVRRDSSHGFLPIMVIKPVTHKPAMAIPESTSLSNEEIRTSTPTIAFMKTADTPEAGPIAPQQPQEIRMLVHVPSETPCQSLQPNVPEFCVDTAKAIYPGLHLGATFDSYQELTKLVAKFQMAKGVHLYVRSSRRLYPALNHVGQVIRDYNQSLEFAEVYYACTKGGRRFVRRVKGTAEVRNCPFNIKVRLTRDGKQLYIRDICPAHNHVLERGVVPRPVTHAPQPLLDDLSQRPRVRIMKPPSIIARPPIIQAFVRGELVKDSNGNPRQQVILFPANSTVPNPLASGQRIVPLTVPSPAAKSTGPTVTAISAASATSTGNSSSSSSTIETTRNFVPIVSSIRVTNSAAAEAAAAATTTTTTTTTTMMSTIAPTSIDAAAITGATVPDDNIDQVRIKEEPGEMMDFECAEAVQQDAPSNTEASLDADPIKVEAADEDLEQSLFDADADCAEKSDEKIVPDDGDSTAGDPADEFSADLAADPADDPAGGSGSDLHQAKRPRMPLDLPCPDDRFVMSRQNVLDTMKFCCECGTRVSERYYSDKPDRLSVTLVCEQGHTIDWLLQKIIRRKIPCQLRLSNLLPRTTVRTADAVRQP